MSLIIDVHKSFIEKIFIDDFTSWQALLCSPIFINEKFAVLSPLEDKTMYESFDILKTKLKTNENFLHLFHCLFKPETLNLFFDFIKNEKVWENIIIKNNPISFIGYEKSKEYNFPLFPISNNEIRKHTIIFGSTGKGKSFFVNNVPSILLSKDLNINQLFEKFKTTQLFQNFLENIPYQNDNKNKKVKI